MSRAIKFRAWDKKEKRMYHLRDNPLVHGVLEMLAGMILEAIPYDAWDEWSERCEVMQFTGLHDKNGKEIYEGDILRYPGYNWRKEVVFQDGAFCVRGEDDILGEPLDLVSDFIDTEVTGNIYENPELLK